MAFCLSGLLAAATLSQATVTINLAQSAQNVTLGGGGTNSNNLGTYTITLGTCVAGGGNTSCTLSGSYTSGIAGFTSGTYSLVTAYPGTGPSALQGVQQSSGSNFWNFSFLPAGTTITLTLNSSTGSLPLPVFAGGQSINSATLGLLYATETCTGTSVPSCSVSNVGITSGAIISGPSTGVVTFAQVSQTYYLSQFVYAGGWQTTLTYVNYSTAAVTCVTNFWANDGTPLPVPFPQGTISTRTDVLQPGQVVHDQTTAVVTGMDTEGWAEATCTGPIQAGLLYRLYSSGTPVGEASVNAETSATTKFATFAQTQTGFAYANPSTTQSANITVTIISSAGARLGTTTINIPPMGHASHNVGPLFNGLNFTGFLEITSDIPIVSLSLNAEAFPVFSSLPPGDLPSSTVLVSP